ncbi:hypothetical protein [Thiomicrorhabdus indica]|uniref:hypothetical protein n=1 Tax=Thiomicrorhabdus indica TaxID=2267253 RepID=UPI00102DDB47|nr:hypothetical protein [Thiomicrorhabdus indica]
MKKILLLSALPLLVSVVQASETNDVSVKKSSVEQLSQQNKSKEPLAIESIEQKFWGLNDQEWKRYLTLKSIAEQLSKNETPSTPPEVLGIFAQTTEQRQKYAQLFAKKYVQYVDSSIVSMRMVQAELRKLNEGRMLFDYERLNQIRGDEIGVNDRIQFFTKVNCDECHARLSQLVNQVRFYKVKMDIFIVDDSTDQALQSYAELHVPEDLVKTGFITLNRDKTFIAKHKLSVPVSFISKNGSNLEVHTMD